MRLVDRLAALQLLVVTGKGGVGKRAVTAALGRRLASVGRRVLLLEVDPRESLYQLLGLPPSGGDVVPAGPGLWIQNLRPDAVIAQLVSEQIRIGVLAKRVVSSPVYRHFTDGAPGLKEMAVLGHALRVIRGEAGDDVPTVDAVILDAPASGHGVTLMHAPQLVSEVIRDGPFGRLSRDLFRFVSDPHRSGVVVVTQGEEMPVQEALELLRALGERLGRGPEAVIVNGVYPGPAPVPAGEPDSTSLDLWSRRRAVNEREIGRLREAWSGPTPQLPILARNRGPGLVEGLEEKMRTVLEAEAAES